MRPTHIAAGGDALSCGDGMVHLDVRCRHLARQRLEVAASSVSRKEFYVVVKGHSPGIYISWQDCEAQVLGFAGARYRGVDTYAAAKALLASNAPVPHRNSTRPSASVDSMSAGVAAAVPGGVQRRVPSRGVGCSTRSWAQLGSVSSRCALMANAATWLAPRRWQALANRPRLAVEGAGDSCIC